MLLRGDADLPARAARSRLRPCRFCPASVEDDAQAAAMHLMFCPRASDEAFAAAVAALLELRKSAVVESVASARAGGADAAGQAKAAEQVKTAWAFRLGERVTDVLNRAERT